MVQKRPLSSLVSLMKNGTTAEQNQEGRGLPVSRIETISDGTIDPKRVRHVELDVNDVERWMVQRGDILLSHINSVEHIGKTAIYRGNPEILIHGMNLLLLRPDKSVVQPEYLHYGLRSSGVRDHIRARCKQAVNQASINQKELGAIELPVPSLLDQGRIIDLLSRAEGIVRLRREAEKKSAELIPALFLDMFGDPTANPKGWPTRPLGELVAFMSGGTPSKARQDFWEGNLPWVSPKDMKRMAITDAIDHVNRKILTETNIKLVPVGSLLIVVRGMILIHTVPVAISRAPLTINQDMKALTPQIDTNSTYLLWLMKVSQPQLLNLVSTAAHGTKKLETERLEALPIPLPPLEAQAAFANQVAQIESIQTQQSAAFTKALSTFNALLAQTFANQVQTA